MTTRFTTNDLVPLPRERVFAFFCDATNLEAITPPWVRFRIVTPQPIEMKVGALIDYRLRVHGIPLRWRSEITVWDPPYRFVDEQRIGPYRYWRHEHLFLERPEGTLIEDRVDFEVLGGSLVRRFLVEPDISRIFAHRRQCIRELLTGPQAEAVHPTPTLQARGRSS